MAYDPNSPMLTMGAKIVQITPSPIYLKITRHNKTQDRDEERYWLEQHMSKEAVQKVLSGQFKDGDEINITIDKTKHFDGGIQLLTDIAAKSNGGGNGYKGGGGYKKSPEEIRSIENQKSLDIAARVFESLIGKSDTKVSKTYKEIMAEIRAEARLIVEDWNKRGE